MSDNQAPAETRETVTFDNGRVYKREGDRYVWRTSPDNIGDIIAERDMVWAFDKIAIAQADLAAARREVETAQAEARLRGETIDALRKELQAEKENNTLIAQAANFNAVLAVEELRVEMLGDTLHTAKDGRVRGLCANCLTWHDIGDMWAECRACFDETTGKALCEQVETVKQDLATARAALEDVRRVEAWKAADLRRYVYSVANGDAVRWIAVDPLTPRDVHGDSLEALGRALAQEAGDGR